ncbi:GNAT family N-acetyltransferase [Geomonas sp. RF6]|uniref:GNAT family N-acetyltransferase n=1 Tax=Geomonas sp. RF6 TaxID=2897342 RepID=UPI001E5690B7|nr:GNAT family N-acetyltransferase [Geomonas sp. RF6]UFS69325.1 GNAT family N-acetyltransferase [Geomonas sp. RF6]
MSFEIREVGSKEEGKWDEFVLAHPEGTIYHHSAWRKVLETTYGYRPLYLALAHSRSGEFHGVYPSMLVQSRLTGNRLVSLPFTSYSPPLMPAAAIAEVVHHNLKNHPEIEYFELKSRDPLPETPEFLVHHNGYVTHLLDLTIGESGLLRAFHPTSIRQRIRRAEKNGFRLRLANSVEDLKSFYALHINIRRKHGLPPHPFKFFCTMYQELVPKNLLFVPLLEYQGKVVAGAFTLRFKETFTYEYSATDENYLHLSSNQALIWEVMKIGLSEGAACFDFGRSSLDNPTLIEFKERWGAKRHPLSYYYYPKMGKVGTEGSLGRRLLNRANRIMPKALLQMEGEWLYRHLG